MSHTHYMLVSGGESTSATCWTGGKPPGLAIPWRDGGSERERERERERQAERETERERVEEGEKNNNNSVIHCRPLI